MKEEQARPLLSRPISEIEMDRIDQQYVARVQWYLESQLQCHMAYLSEQGKYLITFPEGTLEETYRGQSTQWTHRTTIRFPNGETLQKYVSAPLNPTQHSQTTLSFPHHVLDGPEPPVSVRQRRTG